MKGAILKGKSRDSACRALVPSSRKEVLLQKDLRGGKVIIHKGGELGGERFKAKGSHWETVPAGRRRERGAEDRIAKSPGNGSGALRLRRGPQGGGKVKQWGPGQGQVSGKASMERHSVKTLESRGS